MPERKRVSASERAKAWKIKKGIARKACFPKGEIKGTIIYRNSEAVPVPREIAERGKRKPFTLENVEWISTIGRVVISPQSALPAGGGYGFIHWGKIKFKGKPSSERVVIKEYSGYAPFRTQQMHEVIEALERSKANHPKMAYFEANGIQYIAMEPFVKVGEERSGIVYSKFSPADNFIHNMNLFKKSDQIVFRETAEQLVLLTKAGLMLEGGQDAMLRMRADIFNGITLRDGSVKVFVQDLDTLYFHEMYLSREHKTKVWRQSSRALMLAVSAKIPYNYEVGKNILNEVARKHGLPEI